MLIVSTLRTLQVWSGVCVARSHIRTVLSPEPLARCRPLGEKATTSTDSAWPPIEAVHRAIGRTLNTACGWYTIWSAVSTDTCEGGGCFRGTLDPESYNLKS